MTTTRTAPQTLRLPLHRDPAPTRTRLTTRRLPVLVYLAVLLLAPAAVVGVSVAAGWWRTTGTSLVAPTSAVPQESPAAPADPADVKGSMTVQAVVDAFPAVTVADVLQAFEAPPDTAPSTQLKTLVEGGSLDVPAFREWLAERVGG